MTEAVVAGRLTDEVVLVTGAARRTVAELTATLGKPITVLVNNAGKNAYADATKMTVDGGLGVRYA
jgi:NAD(P)-dependent dehydrogenase (short-subunit alcohol dehydrogenase family)